MDANATQTDFSALLFPGGERPIEIRTARGRVLVVLDGEAPDRPPLRTDPAAPDYNEAERLPPEWRPLVGSAFFDDRRTVGSLADVLEALPPAVRDEWRAICEAEREAGEDEAAFLAAFRHRSEFEDAHGIECDSYGLNLRDPATGEYIVEQW